MPVRLGYPERVVQEVERDDRRDLWKITVAPGSGADVAVLQGSDSTAHTPQGSGVHTGID